MVFKMFCFLLADHKKYILLADYMFCFLSADHMCFYLANHKICFLLARAQDLFHPGRAQDSRLTVCFLSPWQITSRPYFFVSSWRLNISIFPGRAQDVFPASRLFLSCFLLASKMFCFLPTDHKSFLLADHMISFLLSFLLANNIFCFLLSDFRHCFFLLHHVLFLG